MRKFAFVFMVAAIAIATTGFAADHRADSGPPETDMHLVKYTLETPAVLPAIEAVMPVTFEKQVPAVSGKFTHILAIIGKTLKEDPGRVTGSEKDQFIKPDVTIGIVPPEMKWGYHRSAVPRIKKETVEKVRPPSYRVLRT